MSEVLKFADNELEIAMITYKRPTLVREWLCRSIVDIINYNIFLSIYDSSDDNETQSLIEEFNNKYNGIIHYNKLPSSMSGGYKYIPPIIKTSCDYIMVVGDSRHHSIADIYKSSIGLIKGKEDLIILSYYDKTELNNKQFKRLDILLRECFIPITCCGFTIFRSTIFKELRNDSVIHQQYDSLYKDKYGFAYLGYYLNCYANNGQSATIVNIPWKELSNNKKKVYWHSKFYECWCDELCQIMDSLPNEFGDKDLVLKEAWKNLHLDSIESILRAKKGKGLRYKDYKRMVSSGYLQRVTNKTKLFLLSSILPYSFLKIVTNIYCFLNKSKQKRGKK